MRTKTFIHEVKNILNKSRIILNTRISTTWLQNVCTIKGYSTVGRLVSEILIVQCV